MTGRLLAIAATVLISSAPVFAQCSAQVGFGNFKLTFALCDDSGPVTGTIQAFGPDDLATTTDDAWICLSSDQSIACSSTQAGVVGDGQIAFKGNWISPNIDGCPTGGPARGRNFYTVRDASGQLLLFSVGLDPGLGAYVADSAWPTDGSTAA